MTPVVSGEHDMRILVPILAAAGTLLGSTVAMAAPEVALDMTAERMVETTNEEGETVRERRPASEVEPGDVVYYTIQYSNSGDEPATNVEIDNPLPEGTSYVSDSAWGEGSRILFSIDDGQTFKEPASLTYTVEKDGQKRARKADPEEYSHIRWVVDRIPADSSGEVGFEARVQ
jgi:uncharacterized repeat protein (TIGR01451 family)